MMPDALFNQDLWTLNLLKAYLEEAADTLKRMPLQGLPAGMKSQWPDIICEWQWPADPDEVKLSPPSPAAIDRMDEVIRWLRWVETKQDLQLIWMRARNIPWKVITSRLNCSRTTAWHQWRFAVLKLCSALNNRQIPVLKSV